MFGRKKKQDEQKPAAKPEPPSTLTWLPVKELGPSAQKGPNWLPTTAPPPRPSSPESTAALPTTDAKPARSDPKQWAPNPPAAAAPKPAVQKPNPKERELWADPVLSPWAPAPSQTTTPAQPLPASGMDVTGVTTCPRCATKITYPRRGSPPWDVLCPQCGARGRMTK